ncbi:MAG: DUF1059 domain-containing protein [Anaerolineae bacterium]
MAKEKVFHCKSIGMDCDYTARGQTEEEVMEKVGAHAKAEHRMAKMPAATVEKVRAAIHEESEDCPDCGCM